MNKKLIVAATITLALMDYVYADSMKKSGNAPFAGIAWSDTGIGTPEVGTLKASPVWGDNTKSRHGTLIKMPHGFSSPVHTHSADIYGTVVKGMAVNTADGDSNEVILEPGSTWYQPGKAKHVTKCVSDEDCILLIYQPGKFDYLAADAAHGDHKDEHAMKH